MVDTQMTCQGCGAQFKTREELQKHEKECAAMKHIQGNQPKTQSQGGGTNQGITQSRGGSQQGRTQSSGPNQTPGAQPEKTRTARGGGSGQESE